MTCLERLSTKIVSVRASFAFAAPAVRRPNCFTEVGRVLTCGGEGGVLLDALSDEGQEDQRL